MWTLFWINLFISKLFYNFPKFSSFYPQFSGAKSNFRMLLEISLHELQLIYLDSSCPQMSSRIFLEVSEYFPSSKSIYGNYFIFGCNRKIFSKEKKKPKWTLFSCYIPKWTSLLLYSQMNPFQYKHNSNWALTFF